MYGSLVFSRTSLVDDDNVVSLNHHTSSIFVANLNKNHDATIKLNSIYEVLIPHAPSGAAAVYTKIPGDYTTIQCLTADVILAVFAVG